MEAQLIHDLLAALLQYPGEDYRDCVARAAQALADVQPDAAPLLEEFSHRIERLSTEDLQELFIQTFDLNPLCSLEVGWHLFGENYDRGDFLVKMRQELRRHGLRESSELPDHLTHVLAVLGRMEPAEADKLAGLLFPALDKMRAGFAESDNPFKNVLDSIAFVVESRHPRLRPDSPPDVPALRVWDERGLR